jgi:hypothetical protein
MGTKPTYPHGRTEGYILLDAVLAISLAVLLSGAIACGLALAARSSAKGLERTLALIAERSADALAP